MRTLVTTDTHGNYKGLVQSLERANFDQSNDRLIHLGDVSDRGPETKQCVDFLLKHNVVALRGNHDVWTNQWMQSYGMWTEPVWTTQGGKETIDSYDTVPESHREFFKNQLWYYVDDQNRAFVHAGWDQYKYDNLDDIVERDLEDLVWVRSFWNRAKTLHFTKSYVKNHMTKYDEVFIGHSVVEGFRPVKYCEVWNLDTGAVYGGVLTVMDVDTHEYWQSDSTEKLYPNLRR